MNGIFIGATKTASCMQCQLDQGETNVSTSHAFLSREYRLFGTLVQTV